MESAVLEVATAQGQVELQVEGQQADRISRVGIKLGDLAPVAASGILEVPAFNSFTE